MRLAAEAAAHKLLDAGWVQKGVVRYETRSMPVERYGDVLKMIRVPQVEGLFEPQKMTCTQVVDAGTGKPYVDDRTRPSWCWATASCGSTNGTSPPAEGIRRPSGENLASG